MTAAPDFMPVLSAGKHDFPEQGACVMEYVSILAGEPFSDVPACTEYFLARAAWTVNDSLEDDERHLLIPYITRLIGTSGHEYDEKAMIDALVAIELNRTFKWVKVSDRDATTSTLGEMVAYLRTDLGWFDDSILSEVVYRLIHVFVPFNDGPGKVAMLGKILDAFDSVTGHTDAGDLTEQINQAAALIGAHA